jgi:hypothetical protein
MLKREQNPAASVRPAVLRAYYEAAFGNTNFPESALPDDATFDEFFALQRIRFPGTSRRTVAAQSRRFRELAATFPDERQPQPLLPGLCSVGRQTELDLTKTPIDHVTKSIQVSRVKNLTGLSALRKPGELINFHLTLCYGSAAERLSPPVTVEDVQIVSCGPSLVDTVLRSVRARRVHINQQEVPVFDAGVLGAYTELHQLSAFAGLVRGVSVLSGLPIEVLCISNVGMDEELRSTLSAVSGTLKNLTLENEEPFRPTDLPALPHLTRLTVPAYPQYRKEWLEFALSHSQTGCHFPPVKMRGDFPKAEVAEIYRGVDILRIETGKKVRFEVSGDLTKLILKNDMDNGDLEDELHPLATKSKKKFVWSSEADTFVAQATRIEDARWLIDQIYRLSK